MRVEWSAISRVTIVRDDDGVEAARFRASTSGATVLYDIQKETP